VYLHAVGRAGRVRCLAGARRLMRVRTCRARHSVASACIRSHIRTHRVHSTQHIRTSSTSTNRRWAHRASHLHGLNRFMRRSRTSTTNNSSNGLSSSRDMEERVDMMEQARAL